MIQSIFLLSPVGEVLIERHFRGVVTSRSVCDTFWEQASVSINHHGGVSATTSLLLKEQLYDSVPPVLKVFVAEQGELAAATAAADPRGIGGGGGGGGTLYVISILRDGLSYLAVCPAEVSPLLILEFLNRIYSIFVDYFGSPADESTIKDNFSTVYQLLEEMVDHGWPLTTEPNALKGMIRPPTVMSKLLQGTSTLVSDELPSGTVSNMPWRAAGVSYSQNEIYMDILEEVDAIVSNTGAVITSDVSGSIQCQSHLSGIPDLLLTFKDPDLIDDCSFHPCVRYALFERDQVVSFVPPDGDFELMRYRIRPEQTRNFSPPVYCHAQWSFSSTTAMTPNKSNNTNARMTKKPGLEEPLDFHSSKPAPTTSGRIVLQCGVTGLTSLIYSSSRKGPLVVEEVAVTIPLPKQTRSTSGFQVTMGNVIFDEAGKVARWNLGKMDASKRATLTCNFTVDTRTQRRGRQRGSICVGATKSIDTNKSGLVGRVNDLDAFDHDDDNDDDNDKKEGLSPPNLSLSWKIPLASVSGLSVSGLSIRGENYRPYKGVRNITKSGVFQVRCN